MVYIHTAQIVLASPRLGGSDKVLATADCNYVNSILSHLQNHEVWLKNDTVSDTLHYLSKICRHKQSVSLKNDTVSDNHHYPSKTCQHKHISMMIFQLIKV
jgi:hypothetical protein